MTDVPHFAYPFSLIGGRSAATVEQDDPDDIESCVVALLKTPVNFRLDIPEFGCQELLFRKDSTRVNRIKDAINKWEPRAEAEITSQPDKFLRMVARVTADIEGRSDA